MIFISMVVASMVQAAPPASGGCRAFVEHVLKKKSIDSLRAARSTCTVEDSGQDPDRPFVRVDCPRPNRMTVESYPASASVGGYELKLVVPPMREFVYRLRVQDHVCGLDFVMVNGYPQRHGRTSCANPQHANEGQRGYIREACEIGARFFVQPERPTAPGSIDEERSSPSSRRADGT